MRSQLLAGLEAARQAAAGDQNLPERLPDGRTPSELLLMVVIHNSYHLGQIALLRQLKGLWPPAGGSDGWQ